MTKKATYAILAILAFFILSLSLRLFSPEEDGKLHLKVYDVGQGDAIFIQTPNGYTILVDGGPNNRVLDHLGKDLGPSERKLDFVILTHPQADHLYGLIEVLRRYEVGQVLVSGVENTTELYQKWTETLKQQGLTPRLVVQGQSLKFPDGVALNFLWPTEEHPAVSDLNHASVVFRLDYGSFNAELTGDGDRQIQPFTSTESEIEVLKVPHHGSKTALNEVYLDQISPEVSIISAGEKNRYGHPNQVLLEQLEEAGSKIYRTDQQGVIEVVSDGKSWYTKPEKGN